MGFSSEIARSDTALMGRFLIKKASAKSAAMISISEAPGRVPISAIMPKRHPSQADFSDLSWIHESIPEKYKRVSLDLIAFVLSAFCMQPIIFHAYTPFISNWTLFFGIKRKQSNLREPKIPAEVDDIA